MLRMDANDTELNITSCDQVARSRLQIYILCVLPRIQNNERAVIWSLQFLNFRFYFFQVECRIHYPIRGSSPPVPEKNQKPTRELFAGWCEYAFTDDRTFFYNSKTGEKSWKPPRRRCNTDVRIDATLATKFSPLCTVSFFNYRSSIISTSLYVL